MATKADDIKDDTSSDVGVLGAVNHHGTNNITTTISKMIQVLYLE
jgi:hypothetical protein